MRVMCIQVHRYEEGVIKMEKRGEGVLKVVAFGRAEVIEYILLL